MQNNRIVFLRNVHSMTRALQNNIFNFRNLNIKTFETYPTFRRIFINFMRAREFINKNSIQQLYKVGLLIVRKLDSRFLLKSKNIYYLNHWMKSSRVSSLI